MKIKCTKNAILSEGFGGGGRKKKTFVRERQLLIVVYLLRARTIPTPTLFEVDIAFCRKRDFFDFV